MSTADTYYAAKAGALWAGMTANERAGVRFGLFPAAVMAKAERDIIAELAPLGERFELRLLSVALMDCASRDGGMRA